MIKIILRIGIAGFALYLFFIITSNLGIFNPNWPFELFASFARNILILSPVVLIVSWRVWRRTFYALLVLAAAAFWPFLTFSKFQAPSHEDCGRDACVSVIFANIHKDENALKNLVVVAGEQSPDVIGISELPLHLSERNMQELFPAYPNIIVVTTNPEGKVVGSGLALISRYPLTNPEIISVPTLAERFWDRVILRADVSLPGEKTANLTLLHPRYPMSPIGSQQRALMLDMAKSAMGESESFILMGDLNMVPWAPDFAGLPGARAGDPRWVYTWDAERPWLAIPIDHIMVGKQIGVVESAVLAGTGSDHRPIMAKLKIR